jgi:hypothetical protein
MATQRIDISPTDLGERGLGRASRSDPDRAVVAVVECEAVASLRMAKPRKVATQALIKFGPFGGPLCDNHQPTQRFHGVGGAPDPSSQPSVDHGT